jgi:hypothetical protein
MSAASHFDEGEEDGSKKQEAGSRKEDGAARVFFLLLASCFLLPLQLCFAL